MFLDNTTNFILFSFIMMRMAGFVLLNPILGRKNIPMIVKTGFIMVLSLVVYSFSEGTVIEIRGSLEFAVLLLKEFVIGYFLGFIMQLFQFIVTYAGEIIDFQMGLSMASVYDAQSNAQVPLTGQLFLVFYTLLFFAVDGHLALIKILITSHEVVGFGEITLGAGAANAVLDIFITCVVMAVKFAFPLLAVQFLSEVGIGILMKVIPQINVFTINMQAKIVIGLVMLVFLFSPISEYLQTIITTMLKTLYQVLAVV